MVFTRLNRAPAHEQGEGSQASQEDLPHPPSLAEVMLEAERNKRETNRLLERIEQNTTRQPRNAAVSLNDFVKLNPPKFHHSVDPLDADDWLCSISRKIRSANVSEADKVTFGAYFLEGPPICGGRILKLCVPLNQWPHGQTSVQLFVCTIFQRA